MKDKVFLAPSGELFIGIPLFRLQEAEPLERINDYNIVCVKDKPAAYVVDPGPNFKMLELMNAEFIESNCEYLGDL